MNLRLFACLCLLSAPLFAQGKIETDLLVVGGTEAGVAAAVQAVECGVKKVTLVSDIEMLGGQFSAEGVGAIDEWTTYQGKRVEFPRSGKFLEAIESFRAANRYFHGSIRPGNGFCASETVLPNVAARHFKHLVQHYNEDLSFRGNLRPASVKLKLGAVHSVVFESTNGKTAPLEIVARLTIDATDWGDVIRLAGAKYAAGPDLRSRFGEPNAPVGPLEDERNEMNPISYCLVLKGSKEDATIPKPARYDERTYLGTTNVTTAEFKKLAWPPKSQQMNVPPFIDTAYPEGIYSAQVSLYTHRRLVDARHLNRAPEEETILVNWPTQDYPLYDFPQHVNEALEATEKGASTKNIVDMSYQQRQIVFDDAKQHALGMLYHLQTTVQARLNPEQVDFRKLKLVGDFNTPDSLPPKPYVREGLRLEALYMLREGDLRMQRDEPRWAKHMAPDSVFAFQFNIDFHPTRRVFLNDDRTQPWVNVHTENRNWSTHTDRACFPLRSLVPVEIDGLLGASKNIGCSSIVSSAVRLHGQMMHTGQAAGTIAEKCLRENLQPRQIAADPRAVLQIQHRLVRGVSGPGVLLWPYQDLRPDDLHFEAANMLAVLGVYRVEDDVDFAPFAKVSRREVATTLDRVRRLIEDSPDWKQPENLDGPADWKALHTMMNELQLKPSAGLSARGNLPLTRAELVQHVWLALRPRIYIAEAPKGFLDPGRDSDGDGVKDLDDPLPLDRDNDNLPDQIDS